MPVSLTITVADPPAAPAGYTLVAFEVRTYRASEVGKPRERGDINPIATLAGTTTGFEEAVNLLGKAVQEMLREVGVGLRLAAVAWWADKPLTECEDGRERMVSIYDAREGAWREWKPEQRVGPRPNESAPRDHRPF